RSQAERLAHINQGELVVVGRNRWTEGLPSPLLAGADGGLFKFDPAAAAETLEMVRASKRRRRQDEVDAALRRLREAAGTGENLMPASIACARARVTTGEWADALREVFGEYRPPTGVEGQRLGLEGARVEAVRAVRGRLGAEGVGEAIPVVMGGIIPERDVGALAALGVKAVFTPKDFDLLDVMERILDVIGAPRDAATARVASA